MRALFNVCLIFARDCLPIFSFVELLGLEDHADFEASRFSRKVETGVVGCGTGEVDLTGEDGTSAAVPTGSGSVT